jgi:hypothetical protein
VISAAGVTPDLTKTKAICQYPVPQNVKELQFFLGLASYYRKFIKGFFILAQPLRSLLQKEVRFEWSGAGQRAFEKLKGKLSTALVLSYPDFDRKFYVETDASGSGLGAVLEQQQEDGELHPVAYACRSLTPLKKRYGVSELEALGVVWALERFRAYLLGHKTVVYTDHAALRSLLNTPNPSGKLGRWGMALQEISPEIRYRPGCKNGNADALFRAPLEPVASVVTVNAKDQEGGSGSLEVKSELPEISEEQRQDPYYGHVIRFMETGVLPEDERLARRIVLSHPNLDLIDDILCFVEHRPPYR